MMTACTKKRIEGDLEEFTAKCPLCDKTHKRQAPIVAECKGFSFECCETFEKSKLNEDGSEYVKVKLKAKTIACI